jgi:transcriptional regulator with XRE-family HTH domain
MTPERREKEMQMLKARGWTYAEIGRRFSITRERVRQILGNKGHSDDVYARRLYENLNMIVSMRLERRSMSEIAKATRIPIRRLYGIEELPEFPPKPITHGKTGYARGCRCQECKAALALYQRNYRRSKH